MTTKKEALAYAKKNNVTVLVDQCDGSIAVELEVTVTDGRRFQSGCAVSNLVWESGESYGASSEAELWDMVVEEIDGLRD